MYVETWSKFFCDCGAVGWYGHGDMSDCTAYEPEGLICWKCKAYLFDEKELRIDHGLDDDEKLEDHVDLEEVDKKAPR